MSKRKMAAIVILLSGVCVLAQSDYTQTNATVASPTPRPFFSGDYVHRLSVGMQFGAPLGPTAKYWFTDMLAMDGAVGWAPEDHSTIQVQADVLFHDFDLLHPPTGELPVYVGGGLFGRFRDDNRADVGGWRFPIGVSYMFRRLPFETFAEVAPEIIFTPFTRAGIDGSIGVRYRF